VAPIVRVVFMTIVTGGLMEPVDVLIRPSRPDAADTPETIGQTPAGR
jgi:hypothetical protein